MSTDFYDSLMMVTVRNSRGMTQKALAQASGVSQATLSKIESGFLHPEEATLSAIAAALDAPTNLLLKPVGFAGPPATVFHRKRASLPVSVVNRLRARLDLLHLQIRSLIPETMSVSLRRHPLADDGTVTPEDVAEEVRAELGISRGPVPDLINILEQAGIAVVRTDLGSAKIDALMSWPPEGRPIVLVGDHAPGDRQRFSVAHELGHAVMHQVPVEEQEQQADRFASAFLVPLEDAENALKNVSIPKLASLKGQWGVSMAALLHRAHDLDTVTDFQYRKLNIAMSQAGFRMREPVAIPAEHPHMLYECIGELIREGCSPAQLAERSWMTEHDFKTFYMNREGEE
jgi:Zn-dependent peptidase ImmA (M78 family)/transcriptional regulator with XRE-family HTH domain